MAGDYLLKLNPLGLELKRMRRGLRVHQLRGLWEALCGHIQEPAERLRVVKALLCKWVWWLLADAASSPNASPKI